MIILVSEVVAQDVRLDNGERLTKHDVRRASMVLRVGVAHNNRVNGNNNSGVLAICRFAKDVDFVAQYRTETLLHRDVGFDNENDFSYLDAH